MIRTRTLFVTTVASALMLGLAPARCEVIEEIVARVNDDAVTRTDLQEAELQIIEEIYSRRSGEDLDKEIAKAKMDLLRELITRKLLVQQADRMYDLAKMQEAFLRQFKDQQKITSNAEFEKILKDEGLALDDLRKRLVEINAPQSVIDYEVRDKISVSDAEIETYYKEHAQEMASPDRVSFREIVLRSEGRSQEVTLELARSLVAKARGGQSIVEIARESSQVDSSLRGGLLGPFTKGELAKELEQVAFSAKPGEISDPIVVGEVVHVIRVEGREESAMPPLDTVKDKIYAAVERQKFNAALNDYLVGLWRRSEVHVPDEYMQRISPDFRKFIK